MPKVEILCIGSCRSALLPSIKYKILNFTYTHTTKEVIQLLEFVYSNIDKQRLIKKEEFILGSVNIQHVSKIRELCDNSEPVLIEISSIKEIKNNKGYYYNQWTVRDCIVNKKEHIEKNITTTLATIDELKNDIEIIRGYFPDTKKIIFQSHINLDFEGMVSLNHITIIPPIQSRSLIDSAIRETSNIIHLIPRDIFKNLDWRKIVLSEDDTAHLNNEGYKILANALDNIL